MQQANAATDDLSRVRLGLGGILEVDDREPGARINGIAAGGPGDGSRVWGLRGFTYSLGDGDSGSLAESVAGQTPCADPKPFESKYEK